ncbi:AI-2E family transporter [Clostridium sp.]|uniref:AI-2E family transporter n=1 Tax=Clostridium sp. TaxID=1506 RepID=UPI002A90BDE3|nr:AI-2E family transporter [Clostridium sp.]MDY6012824.1 AI-2E family transporter [Clostridium sp.]
MKSLTKNKPLIIKSIILLLLILAVVLYLYWGVFREVINIIIVSAILAYILRPLRNFILNKSKLSKKVSTLIIMLSIFLVIVLLLLMIIPKIFNEIRNLPNLINKLMGYLVYIEQKIEESKSSILNLIYNEIKTKSWKLIMSVSNDTINRIINFSSNIVSVAIIPIVTYYFLSDGTNISNKLYLLVPIEKRNLTKKIIEDINLLLERYIVSQILLSLITGIMCFILFLILDIKFMLLLAIINGVFNVVPYFGAFFGGVPAVLIAFMDSPIKGLWVIIGILIVQQIEGNILAPKITAESTNIHPLLIIILLLIGERTSGVVGMILAIPIGVILKVIYDDLNYYLF